MPKAICDIEGPDGEVCGRECKNRAGLLRHQKNHGPHICAFAGPTGVCAEKFEVKSHLEEHMRKHKPYNERPYVCDVAPPCAQRFWRPIDLDVHIKTHRLTSEDAAFHDAKKAKAIKANAAKAADAAKAGLIRVTMADDGLLETIDGILDDIEEYYNGKNLDGREILKLAFWRGPGKDAQARVTRKEVLGMLKQELLDLGYDSYDATFYDFLDALYDENGTRKCDAKHSSVGFTKEVLDHIKETQRYCVREIATLRKTSRHNAKHQGLLYAASIAEYANTSWAALLSAGKEYDAVLFKQKFTKST